MAACYWTCEGSIQSHRVVLCRERSGARIDIVNFWGDQKSYLWKAC